MCFNYKHWKCKRCKNEQNKYRENKKLSLEKCNKINKNLLSQQQQHRSQEKTFWNDYLLVL